MSITADQLFVHVHTPDPDESEEARQVLREFCENLSRGLAELSSQPVTPVNVKRAGLILVAVMYRDGWFVKMMESSGRAGEADLAEAKRRVAEIDDGFSLLEQSVRNLEHEIRGVSAEEEYLRDACDLNGAMIDRWKAGGFTIEQLFVHQPSALIPV